MNGVAAWQHGNGANSMASAASNNIEASMAYRNQNGEISAA
jgi:hypothetical protein